MANYKIELMDKVVKELLDRGWRVFVAESGTHGFYTNESGDYIVSIQSDYGGVNVSGNYRSQLCGTGWRIDDVFNIAQAKSYFECGAPRWATRGESVKKVSLSGYLDSYQKSSKFTERKKG
jgi:hypothetical protein